MNTKQALSTYILTRRGITFEKLTEYIQDYELLSRQPSLTITESRWFDDVKKYHDLLEYDDERKLFDIPNLKSHKQSAKRKTPPSLPQVDKPIVKDETSGEVPKSPWKGLNPSPRPSTSKEFKHPSPVKTKQSAKGLLDNLGFTEDSVSSFTPDTTINSQLDPSADFWSADEESLKSQITITGAPDHKMSDDRDQMMLPGSMQGDRRVTFQEQEEYADNLSLSKIELQRRFKLTTIRMNELVVRPDVFDGIRPRPREWWHHYTDCVVINGWSNLVAIKYFSTFLSGAARDWYTTELAAQIRDCELRKFSQLEKAFAANFIGDVDLRELQREFDRTRQGPHESISTFLPRLRKMLQALYGSPNSPSEIKREIRQIIGKLRPEYQMDMAKENPQTIDDLRKIALQIENGRSAYMAAQGKVYYQHMGETRSSGPHERYSPRRRVRFGRSFSRSPSRSPHRSKSPRTRYQSPLRRQIQQRPATPERTIYPRQVTPRLSGQKPSNPHTCYRCGKEGHWARDCRVNVNSLQQSKEDKLQIQTGLKQEDDLSTELNTIKITKHCGKIGAGKQPFIIEYPVKCNGVTMKGLVDTGSQVTVIDEKLLINNQWKVTHEPKNMTGAGGNRLNSPGSAILNLEVTIGQTTKTKNHLVAVVKDFTSDFLIGLDLLSAFQVCINAANQTLTFEKGSVAPGIRTLKKTILAPRSQQVITAKINEEGTILSVPFLLEKPSVLVGNVISTVKDNQVDLIICNPTAKKIELPSNLQLANYEKVEDNNELAINTVHELDGTDIEVSIDNNLDENQQDQLKAILLKYRDAFSSNGRIGLTSLTEHKIELLPDAKPHTEPLRRRPYADIEECRKQVKELLEKDYIENADSPWASAYVVVKKKTGDKRLCIDFRKLNDCTKKVVYPLPNIDDCLDTLAGKSYFSTLDMASGFWQIPMEEKSKELTAFRTEDGLFQFKRMPFGLTNAPASFQRMVNAAFAGLKGINLQVFIDDVCIATDTWNEHLDILKQVFMTIIKSNLTLKGSKCIFGAKKIIFLGHEISGDGIKQDPSKLIALKKLPVPKDRDGVRRFLGMSGYYRKFVQNFATLAEPLTQLTRKNVNFVWEDKQQKSYDSIIAELEKNACLAHFNHTDPLMLKTDASKLGVAGILLQQQKGDWKIITCCSRRLNTSESNYGITDLEGLAIIYCLEKLRNYLLGKHFEIIVDHCALCVLNKRMPNSARLRRWAIIISEYDFEIKYTKGGLHKDVDCLSRAPIDDGTDPYLDNKVYIIMPENLDEWKEQYEPEVWELLNQDNKYKIRDEIIYYEDRLFVPTSKREAVIRAAHTSFEGGHGGYNVTLNKLKDYFWPQMTSDIRNYVTSCHTCQMRKVERAKPSGDMYHHDEASAPLEEVAIDAWNINKASRRNNKVVITAIDTFTKYISAKAIDHLNAPAATDFLNEYIGNFGIPKAVKTDNARDFCGVIFKETLEVYHIQHKLSTPGHSQGNAVIERAIQTLQDRLSSAVSGEDSQDWDVLLPSIVYSINTSVHRTTKYTPYELLFGREPTLRSTGIDERYDPKDHYAQIIKKHMELLHKTARENSDQARMDSRPRHYDEHRFREFTPGDRVLARNATSREYKAGYKYIGPMEVVSRNKDIYELTNLVNGKQYHRHVSSLKPYRSPEPLTSRVVTAILMIITFQLLVVTCFDTQTPYLYVGTQYEVEEGRTFVYMNIKLDNPCPRIDITGLQPEGCVQMLVGQHRTRSPLPDRFGDYAMVTKVMEGNHYLCPTMQNITQDGIYIGLGMGKPRYETGLMEALLRTKQECYVLWEQVLADSMKFVNTAIKAREGQVEPIKEPTLQMKKTSPNPLQTDILYSNILREYPLPYQTPTGWQSMQPMVIPRMGPNIHIIPQQAQIATNLIPNYYRPGPAINKWNQPIQPPVRTPMPGEDTTETPTTQRPVSKATKENSSLLESDDFIFPASKRERSLEISTGPDLPRLIDDIDIQTPQKQQDEIKDLLTDRIQEQIYRYKRGWKWDAALWLGRQVIGSASSVAGIVGINIVTDIVKTAWEHFDPQSNYNRINRLERMAQETFQSISIHQEVLETTVNNTILNQIAINLERTDRLASARNWHLQRHMQYELNERLKNARDGLLMLSRGKADGVLDAFGFYKLTNITDLMSIRQDHLVISSVTNLQTNAQTKATHELEIRFQIIETSDTAHVYNLEGIPHWRFPKTNGSHVPAAEFVTMRTTKVIYDEQYQCLKKIKVSEHPKLTHKQCHEKNYIDPSIQKAWELAKTSEDPEKSAIEDDIFEFRDRTHSYIYCFPNEITFLNAKPAKCPFKPFKLNINVPYNISRFNKTWAPVEQNSSIVINYDDVIDTIHPAHFLENEGEFIQEDILETRRKLKLSEESIANVGITIQKGTIARLISWTIWISVVSLTSAMIYCFYRLGFWRSLQVQIMKNRLIRVRKKHGNSSMQVKNLQVRLMKKQGKELPIELDRNTLKSPQSTDLSEEALFDPQQQNLLSQGFDVEAGTSKWKKNSTFSPTANPRPFTDLSNPGFAASTSNLKTNLDSFPSQAHLHKSPVDKSSHF